MGSTPVEPTPEQLRHELAVNLLELSEQLTPVIDSADGMKADLERRGWSPTAAEQGALAYLIRMIQIIGSQAHEQ